MHQPTLTLAVLPRGVRPGVPWCGAEAGGGGASNVVRKGKRNSGRTPMKYANTRGGITICSRSCWRIAFCGGSSCTWEKPPALKPAMTPIPVQLSEHKVTAFILPHLSMPRRSPKCTQGYRCVFTLIL